MRTTVLVMLSLLCTLFLGACGARQFRAAMPASFLQTPVTVRTDAVKADPSEFANPTVAEKATETASPPVADAARDRSIVQGDIDAKASQHSAAMRTIGDRRRASSAPSRNGALVAALRVDPSRSRRQDAAYRSWLWGWFDRLSMHDRPVTARVAQATAGQAVRPEMVAVSAVPMNVATVGPVLVGEHGFVAALSVGLNVPAVGPFKGGEHLSLLLRRFLCAALLGTLLGIWLVRRSRRQSWYAPASDGAPNSTLMIRLEPSWRLRIWWRRLLSRQPCPPPRSSQRTLSGPSP